jgi:MOSC domain-containing protein YiiM
VPGLVAAVNVVHALIPDVRGALEQTAIDKRPVTGRTRVGPLGVEGDQQFDTRHHGGAEMAVYAYAREDAQWWATELGYDIPPGRFGENLSTTGLAVTDAVLGERWAVGGDGLVLEVTLPRIPCATFQGFMGEPHWVRRFTERGAPGTYLSVTSPGTVAAGDPIEVVHRPAHGVTVGEAFAIRDTDAHRLRAALDDPGVYGKMALAIRRDLAARARTA